MIQSCATVAPARQYSLGQMVSQLRRAQVEAPGVEVALGVLTF